MLGKLQRKNFQRGCTHYNNGKYREASNFFLRAVKERPDDAQAMALYASSLAAMGDFGRAMRFAKAAIATNPKVHEAHTCLSHCYCRLGRYDLVLEHARKTIEFCPDQPHGFINKASALIDIEDFRGARVAAKKAIELDATLPHGYLCRGFIHLGENSWANALEDSKKSLSNNWDKNMYPRFFDFALQGAAYFLGKRLDAKATFLSAMGEHEKATGMIVDREVHKKMLLVLEGLLHLEETCEAKREWRRRIRERIDLALEDKVDLEDGERQKVHRLLGVKEERL